MTVDEILADLRLRAAIARDDLRSHARVVALDLADEVGLGAWYREELGREKRRAEFRRMLAVDAYWGIPSRRMMYGGICGA